MPSKKPAQQVDDLRAMVIEQDERTDAAEKKLEIHDQRIGVLEKHATSMSGLPVTVALLGQKVESMDKSIVDGLAGVREQNKAHKEELGKQVLAIGIKVDGLGKQEQRQIGWRQSAQIAGQILLALAVIGEAVKAVLH